MEKAKNVAELELDILEDEDEWGEAATGFDGEDSGKEWNGEISLAFNEANNPKLQRKPSQRRKVTAKDKECAELVHKAHLLCLLGRGRIVDAACNDPLLQASMLSLIPPHLGQSVSAAPVGGTKVLEGIVSWFMRSFRHVAAGEGPSSSFNGGLSQEECSARLRRCIDKQAGSAEDVAALSVVALRTLGFLTRYVTVLDVVSLLPDADGESGSQRFLFKTQGNLDFETGGKMASLAKTLAKSLPKQVNGASTSGGCWESEGRLGSARIGSEKSAVQDSKPTSRGRGKRKGAGRGEGKIGTAVESLELPTMAEKQKRAGDEEFERQLAMAIAATSAVAEGSKLSKTEPSEPAKTPPEAKRKKSLKCLGSNGNASWKERLGLTPKQEAVKSSGAAWSKKLGPVMHWAEVYCRGEENSGRWVHVDAARGLVDGADQVQAAAATCSFPLRYVVAFAGGGAKDVTRRYVTLWSSVERLRVDKGWWDNTLNPLMQLEAAATTAGPNSNSHDEERNALEDMEMETKTFTEPLPTNQQAYKSHHLYVIEKWLTKYQTLHPKGPVLGYCAGHPVYPRACVQVLHTPDSWLREGFKVKPGETPAKMVKQSRFVVKKDNDLGSPELDGAEEKDVKPTMIALFGKWQTNPWQPPRAVDGKVPRNERGQVDVWSEKCIPPGTVHLRFPGLVPLVQNLGIDFAPAMVGFEVRKGRTFPVYEGLVVCEEFKDLIMDAYEAHEEIRLREQLKKSEEKAKESWRRLLHSMATRQRLQIAYEKRPVAIPTEPRLRETLNSSNDPPIRSSADGALKSGSPSILAKQVRAQNQMQSYHVHHYPEENQSFSEDTGIRTKVCDCGFTYYVEEM